MIGIIAGKLGESFKVDIGSYLPAQLSFYAFEGATKKNKPDLKVSGSGNECSVWLSCLHTNGTSLLPPKYE